MQLRVQAIPGEPTRFRVESNSLECLRCHKLFSRQRGNYHVGQQCPHCKASLTNDVVFNRILTSEAQVELAKAELDVRFHTVDISTYNRNGWCSCEYFEFSLATKLRGILPNQQAEGRYRCSHIDAARDFALDVALVVHKQETGEKDDSET